MGRGTAAVSSCTAPLGHLACPQSRLGQLSMGSAMGRVPGGGGTSPDSEQWGSVATGQGGAVSTWTGGTLELAMQTREAAGSDL